MAQPDATRRPATGLSSAGLCQKFAAPELVVFWIRTFLPGAGRQTCFNPNPKQITKLEFPAYAWKGYVTAGTLVCLGSVSSISTANAGDTASCCVDLESRIVELSQVTPRSQRLEIEISGQLHRSVLFWSDGVERNAYVVEPASGGSYFTFSGDAELPSKWEAGFMLEIEIPSNSSDELSQSISKGAMSTAVGASNFFIGHEELGRITVGMQTEAHDHITELDLSATDSFASPAVADWNGNFLLRPNRRFTPGDPLIWSFVGADDIGDGDEASVVRFDTPEERKLQASLSWGMGGVSAAALRFNDDWENFAVTGGAAFAYYAEDTRSPCRDSDDLSGCGTLAGSLSLKHKPTSIIASLASGLNVTRPTDVSGDNYWYYAKIAKAWSLSPLGATTTYAEYFHGKRNVEIEVDQFRTGVPHDVEINARTNVYGIGIMQTLEEFEIDFYLALRHYEADVSVTGANSTAISVDDFDALMTGSRITF
ncbi:MAG: hypothetical protein KJ622_07210 [Alphaproteobacteria bacterium]|nr:hypothetical protein [Alphaproteobacteria bacterium]